jgi:hypothetical protein
MADDPFATMRRWHLAIISGAMQRLAAPGIVSPALAGST